MVLNDAGDGAAGAAKAESAEDARATRPAEGSGGGLGRAAAGQSGAFGAAAGQPGGSGVPAGGGMAGIGGGAAEFGDAAVVSGGAALVSGNAAGTGGSGSALIAAAVAGTSVLSPAPTLTHPLFDTGHAESLDKETSACVHCGFCLPACPTYALTGDENDSPRGRIHLVRQVVTGQAELDASVAEHVDGCLGCLSCVSACPSGVRYDRIIEEFRPAVETAYADDRGDKAFRRMVFALFPHPLRLRIAAVAAVVYRRTGGAALVRSGGLLRRFPRLAAMEALMPATGVAKAWSRVPRRTEAVGARRRTVGLVTGCVQRVFFADVNAATVRVLAAEGCAVEAPRQGCCGALSLHAGREEEAKRYARAMIDAFDRPAKAKAKGAGGGAAVEEIVVNVAGCGSTLKTYGELLAGDPAYAARAEAFAAKVRDVSETLAALEPRAERHPIEARVTYHDACHLSHGQGVRSQPREVLASIPGLRVREPAEANFCCGSAGVHNLVRPEAADELGRRKAENLRRTDPDVIATGNPGCLLQIRHHLPDVPVVHPVELLDASIRGEKPRLAQRDR